MYAGFAQILIAKVKKLYVADCFGNNLKNVAYARDSTTTDL
jgi:hypothetical protein